MLLFVERVLAVVDEAAESGRGGDVLGDEAAIALAGRLEARRIVQRADQGQKLAQRDGHASAPRSARQPFLLALRHDIGERCGSGWSGPASGRFQRNECTDDGTCQPRQRVDGQRCPPRGIRLNPPALTGPALVSSQAW